MVAYLDQETIDWVGFTYFLKSLDCVNHHSDCSTDTIDWWTESHYHFASALLRLDEGVDDCIQLPGICGP